MYGTIRPGQGGPRPQEVTSGHPARKSPRFQQVTAVMQSSCPAGDTTRQTFEGGCYQPPLLRPHGAAPGRHGSLLLSGNFTGTQARHYAELLGG